jgi:hypothetical protein
MKESDFKDIGKRLYDEEAEPPKGGWVRIKHTMNAQQPATKTMWLKRTWWIPLLFIVPSLTYMVYEKSSDDSGLPTPIAGQQSSVYNAVEMLDHKTVNEIPPIKNEDVNKKEESIDSKRVNVNESTVNQDQNIKNNSAGNIEAITTTQRDTHSLTVTTLDNPKKFSPETPATIMLPSEQKDQFLLSNGSDRVTSNSASTPKLYPGGPSDPDTDVDDTPITIKELSRQHNKKLPSEKNNDIVSSSPRLDPPSAYDDSVVTALPLVKATDTVTVQALTAEKTVAAGKWRMTASFTPLYMKATINPIDNDDILVTDVKRSGGSKKMGYTFGIGVGKILSPSFVIDGEISFLRGQQSIDFSTATGNIDTLITTVQPNQSVVVSPVYETTARSIAAEYGYAGIKLGGTYYFMEGTHGRFNVSSSVGAYFKVFGNVKEKTDDGWNSRSSSDQAKSSVAFTVSAGYNVRLSKSWELSVNPSTTYYVRKKTTTDLPYNLSQRSFGVNFMLSKTL